MKYRIKQIAENKFIPQVKTWLFGDWYAIDSQNKGLNIDFYANHLWFLKEFVYMYCICTTLEEAKQVITDYKANQKTKIKYPKYHKL